jgi:hypothetical protein
MRISRKGPGVIRLFVIGALLAGATFSWSGDLTPAESATPPIGYYPLKTTGLVVTFDERGYPSGYWEGQLLQEFDQYDPVVGTTVAAEVSLQLDKMKAMGVNSINYALETVNADTAPSCPPLTFPSCEFCYVLGFDWPQPSTTELTNLKAFFDLVASKGMKVNLMLITTHMTRKPTADQEAWLGSILTTVAGHPALGLILLGGGAEWIDTNNDHIMDACGVPGGEPPLWLGPRALGAAYLEWAIPFAEKQGIPISHISAEALVGDFYSMSEASAGWNATDNHLWDPIRVLKHVFDYLGVPTNRRVYALSFYEHKKCDDANGLPCVNEGPHRWAKDTFAHVAEVVGNEARVVATETGDQPPVDQTTWPNERAFESLGFLMHRFHFQGGDFWKWVADDSMEEADTTQPVEVKQRGTAFAYNAAQKELVDLGGFHLIHIPNRSFELGSGRLPPYRWTIAGSGSAHRHYLAGEPHEPQVPSRGRYDLRLITGNGPDDEITATSKLIAVSPEVQYTTTANLRFGWTNDPDPSADPTVRPQVFVAFLYFQASGVPSAVRSEDIFRFFQEDASNDFETFPLQYTTPSDAAGLKIEIGAIRNGLPTQIMLDADNLR